MTPVNEKTTASDAQSTFSDRTLCASPEHQEPPPVSRVPCGAAISIRPPRAWPPSPMQGMRVKTRWVSGVALVLWSINMSLSLVEHFRQYLFFLLLRRAGAKCTERNDQNAKPSFSVAASARVDGVQRPLRPNCRRRLRIDAPAAALPPDCELSADLGNSECRRETLDHHHLLTDA